MASDEVNNSQVLNKKLIVTTVSRKLLNTSNGRVFRKLNESIFISLKA